MEDIISISRKQMEEWISNLAEGAFPKIPWDDDVDVMKSAALRIAKKSAEDVRLDMMGFTED